MAWNKNWKIGFISSSFLFSNSTIFFLLSKACNFQQVHVCTQKWRGKCSLYEQGQDFVFKIPGIRTRYIKLILFIRWRIMSIPWLYNNLYGLHKLNQILLKDNCTPPLWSSYLYLSTCLLHALLHTVDEPDNMKLWHFMNSALNFLQKFWNQILLNTRH